MQPHTHIVTLLDIGRGAVQIQNFDHAQAETPSVHLYHKKKHDNLSQTLCFVSRRKVQPSKVGHECISHTIYVQPVVSQDCH